MLRKITVVLDVDDDSDEAEAQLEHIADRIIELFDPVDIIIHEGPVNPDEYPDYPNP